MFHLSNFVFFLISLNSLARALTSVLFLSFHPFALQRARWLYFCSSEFIFSFIFLSSNSYSLVSGTNTMKITIWRANCVWHISIKQRLAAATIRTNRFKCKFDLPLCFSAVCFSLQIRLANGKMHLKIVCLLLASAKCSLVRSRTHRK